MAVAKKRVWTARGSFALAANVAEFRAWRHLAGSPDDNRRPADDEYMLNVRKFKR
jgi:hypothetical protein